jgi:hypothetical protein
LGRRVVAGGPALFLVQMKHMIADVAELTGTYEDAIARHTFEVGAFTVGQVRAALRGVSSGAPPE